MNNQIETGNLTTKELKDSELVALHKTLFEKHIKRKITKLDIRKMVIRLYDNKINTENIRLYYNRNIKIFTAALVSDRLDEIIKNPTF